MKNSLIAITSVVTVLSSVRRRDAGHEDGRQDHGRHADEAGGKSWSAIAKAGQTLE